MSESISESISESTIPSTSTPLTPIIPIPPAIPPSLRPRNPLSPTHTPIPTQGTLMPMPMPRQMPTKPTSIATSTITSTPSSSTPLPTTSRPFSSTMRTGKIPWSRNKKISLVLLVLVIIVALTLLIIYWWKKKEHSDQQQQQQQQHLMKEFQVPPITTDSHQVITPAIFRMPLHPSSAEESAFLSKQHHDSEQDFDVSIERKMFAEELNSPSQDADIETILSYLKTRGMSLDNISWSDDALRVLNDDTDWIRRRAGGARGGAGSAGGFLAKGNEGSSSSSFIYPRGIQTVEGFEVYYDEGEKKWNMRAAPNASSDIRNQQLFDSPFADHDQHHDYCDAHGCYDRYEYDNNNSDHHHHYHDSNNKKNNHSCKPNINVYSIVIHHPPSF